MTITTISPPSDLTLWNEYLRLADAARDAWAAYEHGGGAERLRTYTSAFRAASDALDSYCREADNSEAA